MFIPYGNSMESQYSMEYCSGIQVESTLCHMDSILFHMDSIYSTWIPHYATWIPHYFTWIPQYSIWIPHYSTIFHMDSIWIPHISTLIAKQYLNISPGVIKQILHFVQSTGLGHMTRLNQ